MEEKDGEEDVCILEQKQLRLEEMRNGSFDSRDLGIRIPKVSTTNPSKRNGEVG